MTITSLRVTRTRRTRSTTCGVTLIHADAGRYETLDGQWEIAYIEDSPGYWRATNHTTGDERCARTIKRLIPLLAAPAAPEVA